MYLEAIESHFSFSDTHNNPFSTLSYPFTIFAHLLFHTHKPSFTLHSFCHLKTHFARHLYTLKICKVVLEVLIFSVYYIYLSFQKIQLALTL